MKTTEVFTLSPSSPPLAGEQPLQQQQDHGYAMFAPDESMWQGHAGKNISVCVIVRTWAGHSHYLGAMLATLAAAAHRNVSVHVIDTGRTRKFTSLHSIVHQFNALAGFEMVKVSNWTSNNSRLLYPAIGDVEDWGYVATDMLIGDMLRWNTEAVTSGRPKPCMALYFTNGDNIMAKGFFLHTLEAMSRGYNMVATNFIHRMANYKLRGQNFDKFFDMLASTRCGGWRPGIDVEFFSQFRHDCVDLAAVITNASLWESRGGTRFVINKLARFHAKANADVLVRQVFNADSTTFETLAQRAGANPLVLRRALVFHQ